MGKGTLTIYSASAGSGKTFILTEVYLKSLFKSKYNYRKILAVTFTNKATAEMKSRILENLYRLATGEESVYLAELLNSTSRSEEWIRKEAGELLNAILHDYSRFSISTIDSFFQRILRSFAREAGLRSGFNIELDHSTILSSAVGEMIGTAIEGTALNRWLTRYSLSNIEEGKSWNLKDGIIKLSEELFSEKFKVLSGSGKYSTDDKELLTKYVERIKGVTVTFEKKLIELGNIAGQIISSHGVTDDMFYMKGRGIPGFVRSLVSGNVQEPNSYVNEIKKIPARWSTGDTDPKLRNALNNGLESIMLEILEYYYANITEYKTSKTIQSNIFALGILTDVLQSIHNITTSENSFLLSDAGDVLKLITAEDQTPFIFEKVGNRYENFMIDEFQDTSVVQWDNLRPLIDNSMAEGFDNLVVGDIKQSIYRWRNSDWRILSNYLNSRIDNDRFISKPLTGNWRSRSNIIKFNNSLFTSIPEILDQTFQEKSSQMSFRKIYAEAVQSDPGKKPGGYVRIEFIENKQDLRWDSKVLEILPAVIEKLQIKGYKASDIGIIVRDGKEGASVLKTFIDYSNNCSGEKKQTFNYNVVSSDSLLLSNSPVITFIVSVLKVVNDPADMISRALMLRFYLLSTGHPDIDKASIESEKLVENSRCWFPADYEQFIGRAGQLTLFEATESIIDFFGLGKIRSNIVYLNTFQDYVVNFSGTKSSDLQSFLDWWENTGSGKSVVLPGNQDAIRILTIHKSKGLEFSVVILPFLSWCLDHQPAKQPFLWVRSKSAPFNDMEYVPVKYGSSLTDTFFSDDYAEEKQAIYIDNLNLLYVAMTRAKDAIYGFSVDNPKSENGIASLLKSAITDSMVPERADGINLSQFYDNDLHVFNFGEIPEKPGEALKGEFLPPEDYFVNRAVESLRLKLHGENYFSAEKTELRKRINYGRLMHEVFEGINSVSDIKSAVIRLILEGKLPEEEAVSLENQIRNLLGTRPAAEWFRPDNEVLTETAILTPFGDSKRPDRVIFRGGKTILIDFKFGIESPHHIEQVRQYRRLLTQMGYVNPEAYLWYVDRNSIVPV